VRGEILTSGWVIEQTGPDASVVTFLAQIDPKVELPSAMYDTAFSNQMQTMYNLKMFQRREM